MIKKYLYCNCSQEEEVQFIIQVEDTHLQYLPWHQWEFFADYPKAELALSKLTYEKINTSSLKIQRKKARILAILGNSKGIDIEKDRIVLNNISSGADITFLVEPDRTELSEYLYDKEGWDILFFAGHSFSDSENETGYIYLNETDSLSLNDLRSSLEVSIQHGLQLAVFNSCEGLGLANDLADLNLPQMIVMREPIPDVIAHEFLKQFLKEFCQGTSLYIAVRRARKKLEGLEKEFPCASWLPIIYQNPGESLLRWSDLHGVINNKSRKRNIVKVALCIALFPIMGFIGNQFLPKSWEIGDKISSGEEVLVKLSSPRLKEKGVELLRECKKPLNESFNLIGNVRNKVLNCLPQKEENNYSRAIKLLAESWNSESRDPETLIYLNNALLEENNIKSYTIAIVVPILKIGNSQNSDQQNNTIDKSEQNPHRAKEFLRGVAMLQTQFNLEFFDKHDKVKEDINSDDIENTFFSHIRKALNKRSKFVGSFNKGESMSGVGLKVIIADDDNIDENAKDIAKKLSENEDILGVIGHYTSEATVASVDIYKDRNLALISPGTTTTELTEEPRINFSRVLFNTNTSKQKR